MEKLFLEPYTLEPGKQRLRFEHRLYNEHTKNKGH